MSNVRTERHGRKINICNQALEILKNSKLCSLPKFVIDNHVYLSTQVNRDLNVGGYQISEVNKHRHGRPGSVFTHVGGYQI